MKLREKTPILSDHRLMLKCHGYLTHVIPLNVIEYRLNSGPGKLNEQSGGDDNDSSQFEHKQHY